MTGFDLRQIGGERVDSLGEGGHIVTGRIGVGLAIGSWAFDREPILTRLG